MISDGGTDMQLFYNLPSGGVDQSCLGVGRIKIKIFAENRAMIWSFYAAQASGDVSGMVHLKNQRIVANKIGHFNLTPAQVALTQLQKANGTRLYLGVLRLGYSSANDVPGPPNATDIAATVHLSGQVRVRGQLVPRTNSSFTMVAFPAGRMLGDISLNALNNKVMLDGMCLGLSGAPLAGVVVFNGQAFKGTALAYLDTVDKDLTFAGQTWQAFLNANDGAFFRLATPVTLTVLDSAGAVVTAGIGNYTDVIVASDAGGVKRAFLFEYDLKNKGVRGGTTYSVGLPPGGQSQIVMRRCRQVMADTAGYWCLVEIAENYQNVYDIRRPTKGKKGGKGAREKITFFKTAVPPQMSKKVKTTWFFVQKANQLLEDLFNPGSIALTGAILTYKPIDGSEQTNIDTVLETL